MLTIRNPPCGLVDKAKINSNQVLINRTAMLICWRKVHQNQDFSTWYTYTTEGALTGSSRGQKNWHNGWHFDTEQSNTDVNMEYLLQ